MVQSETILAKSMLIFFLSNFLFVFCLFVFKGGHKELHGTILGSFPLIFSFCSERSTKNKTKKYAKCMCIQNNNFSKLRVILQKGKTGRDRKIRIFQVREIRDSRIDARDTAPPPMRTISPQFFFMCQSMLVDDSRTTRTVDSSARSGQLGP